MKLRSEDTIFLDKFDTKHSELVGSTARYLYDLTQLDVKVSNSFFITYKLFDKFIYENNLQEFITKKLLSVDINKPKLLDKISKQIRGEITKTDFSDKLKETIERTYSKLIGFNKSYVNILVSPINEELDPASYGKKSETIYNIKDLESLLDGIKELWASLFDSEAIFYREAKGYSGILTTALVVQKTLHSEASGLLFTVDPTNDDASKVQIEVIHGLIEPLLKKELSPDLYLVDKESLKISEKHILDQSWMIVRRGRAKEGQEPNIRVKISESWRKKQKLADGYIEYLTKLALTLEKYHKKELEVEWSLEGGTIFAMNVRPITTLRINGSHWSVTPTAAALKAKLSEGKKEKSVVAEEKLEEVEKIDEYVEEVVDDLVKDEAQDTPLVRVENVSTVTKVFLEISSKEDISKIQASPFDGLLVSYSRKQKKGSLVKSLQEVASLSHERTIIFDLANKDSQSLSTELSVVKSLRNKAGYKNIWVSFRGSLNIADVIEIKKRVTASGLRRSSTFKQYVVVDNPALIIQISQILDIGIDGLIVDFVKFASLTLGKSAEDITKKDLGNESIINMLSELISNVSNIDLIISFGEAKLDQKVLEELVHMGVRGVSLAGNTGNVKKYLEKAESKRILS